MGKKIVSAIGLALANIRSNLFHTFLSVLGIVIGVAALVGILSLIDGMQQYAEDQIDQTTRLKMITVRTEKVKHLDGLMIRKDSFHYLDLPAFSRLKAQAAPEAEGWLKSDFAVELTFSEKPKPLAVLVQAISMPAWEDTAIVAGRGFMDQDFDQPALVAIVNRVLATSMTGGENIKKAIGQTFTFKGRTIEVAGIWSGLPHDNTPRALLPITLLSETELRESPPECTIEAPSVEVVAGIKDQALDWLKQEYGEGHDFRVITNEFRVDQAAQGFRLFRIVMGLIVGISVVVGGIGVMNVLLISVTERTSEIGLRKAMGATRRDILRQFLSESIAISVFGSTLGLILGILGTKVVVPIIKMTTEISFQAAYTWNTLLVIAVVALLVGLLFGTYPAMKAARLDPVEALRRE